MEERFPPETEIAGRMLASPATASISAAAATAAARSVVAAISPG